VSWDPHELNTDFQWRSTRGPFRRVSAEQAALYDTQGFFVLEDVFDSETIQEVTAAIDPLELATEDFLKTQKDGKLFIARAGEITFTPKLVQRSKRLRAFCSGEIFRDLVHDLIGPDVRLYWEQSVYKKPGADEPFPWHQDNGYTYIEPQQYLTCWVALTDADEKNGCPWVVPGIHRGGTLHHRMSDLGWVCAEDPPGAVAAPVRAGGMVVFSSLTPHATGPNSTDAIRKTYIVQFAPDGAQLVQRSADGSLTRVSVDAPESQFPVLVAGEPPPATT